MESSLAGNPEMPFPNVSKVIGVVVCEEYVLAEEIISLEFLLPGEWILWLG